MGRTAASLSEKSSPESKPPTTKPKTSRFAVSLARFTADCVSLVLPIVANTLFLFKGDGKMRKEERMNEKGRRNKERREVK
jgi:hypothetical protein